MSHGGTAPPLLIAALLLVGASAAAGDTAGKGNGKVDVALYYESLCPYSARFVVKHLARVFKDGLLDAVDITLVPYGNARVGKDGAISCQVGPRTAPRARSLALLCSPFLCYSTRLFSGWEFWVWA